MLFKTYVYYEMDEDGVILENEPHWITLKETVDVKKVEKKLNTKLTLIDQFNYEFTKSEFYKFDRKICKDRFSYHLPTFRSFDPDLE